MPSSFCFVFPIKLLKYIRSNDFFSNFNFYGLFNAEFREDFRHGNNSSVTLKSPSLPKFKNIRENVGYSFAIPVLRT